MDTSKHTIQTLFEQLGLPADGDDIEAFVDSHRPLESSVKLHNAPFWSDAQAALLKQAIDDDAEWAEVVDELDALLRHQ
jgi:Protein of unknown function (DUF2789)